ncbi:MAG: Type 1 glutamine amidotransferase-like domain-containing protein [Armatimonadetes bacterium]|nr:Type 1 glutamine amidotransferase-like domain-containing protein [Armatimonadota bacterium]
MRGRILFNGNIRAESDFVFAARDRLLSSRHQDPDVREKLQVLLVTAGWMEKEHEEEHLKKALREIGIPSRMENGFERNIQNLSAYHAYLEFGRREPELATMWKAREELIEAARALYLEKNGFYAALLRRSLEGTQQRFGRVQLARVMTDVTRKFPHAPSHFDGDRLLEYFVGQDIRDTIACLIDNDDRMIELLHELDEHFVSGTGLHFHSTWLELHRDLVGRILSANSIFIFGGHLGMLLRCLNFFRLRDALLEALRRGASFYTVSAGSLLLCERIIIYNDFATEFAPRREFQLFDRGFGLVRHLQLFPHCMDRIQTDDPDNLAYLAVRFQNRTCVGLNEDSFLLMEADPELRFTSVGSRDGVYVFDPSGAKIRYDRGQTIR